MLALKLKAAQKKERKEGRKEGKKEAKKGVRVIMPRSLTHEKPRKFQWHPVFRNFSM